MGKYGFSVFVGNIGRRVRTEDIRDPFKKYGRVLDVDLKNGFGFVEFEDKRDAADAVKELNGLRVQGERITVEMSKVKISLLYHIVVQAPPEMISRQNCARKLIYGILRGQGAEIIFCIM